MDIDSITHQITQWLETFVERPHPALGGWPPCPYARQARITGQIQILAGTNPINDAVSAMANQLWQREVVIYCYETAAFTGEEFETLTGQVNAFIQLHGLFALDDHPNNAELVNGVSFNFGACALMILQLTEKLDIAAHALAAKGYYQDWPEQYLEQLFRGRQDPRS